MKNVKSIIAALSLSAMFGISSANAAVVNVKFDGFEVSPSKTVQIEHIDPSVPTRVNAGMYKLSVAAGSDPSWLDLADSPIFAFCVELEQYISIGSTTAFELKKASEVLNADSVDSIAKLLSSLSSFSFTSDESAIFQASIWELVYDQLLPGDLDNGNFKLVNGGSASVPDNNVYLDAANSYNGALKYELYVLQSDTKQDLLVWREVSAPSTIALFLVMAGLVLVRARKA